MALLTEVTLICDHCGTAFQPASATTGTYQRKLAAEKEWVYSYSMDYCPACRPKTKSGTYHPNSKTFKEQNKQ